MYRVINWLTRLVATRKPECGLTRTGRGAAAHEMHALSDTVLPGLAVDEVLAGQQDVINRIRLCFGVGHDDFEREPYVAIRRYARLVHLLPATRDRHFRTPGGLLRMGLEVALFSLQGTDGHIFAGRATISARRHLEPRWRYATFLAGLCCGIESALSQVSATDEQGAAWQPAILPLADWLEQARAARYFVTWHLPAPTSDHPAMFALAHVISSDALRDLAIDNGLIVPYLLASLAGSKPRDDRNALDAIVRRARAVVIDHHSRKETKNDGASDVASECDARSQGAATHASSEGRSATPSEPTSAQMVLPIDADQTEQARPETIPDCQPNSQISALATEPAQSRSSPGTAGVRIQAPPRLHAAVRHALIGIVDTLNGDKSAQACQAVSSGLFIPLAAFSRRGIDAPLALRTLADAGMLARPDVLKASTVLPESNGEPTLGLLLASRFVIGLPGEETKSVSSNARGHAVTSI